MEWALYINSDEHRMDIIRECIHALKFLIFGADMAGRKSYIGLKRQIRNFNVDFNFGIKKWAARIDDLQAYLPHMLWEAGAKQNLSPTPFNEQDLREILEGCLNKYHLSKLTHIDWDLSEKAYRESISKLIGLEVVNPCGPLLDSKVEIDVEVSDLPFKSNIGLSSGHIRSKDEELEGMDTFGDDVQSMGV